MTSLSYAMRPYNKYFKTRLQSQIQYRAAAWAGFICQFFWGLILIMAMQAFYGSSPEVVTPMTLAATVSYIWLGQAFLGMLPWNVDFEMDAQVRDGSICYELLRPLDLHSYWYLRSLSRRFSTMILRVIPQLIFSALILPLLGWDSWALTLPSNLLALPLWIVSVTLALFLSAAISTVANITLLWSISGAGTNHLLAAFVTLFSGMVVPLPFFPDQWQGFLRFQPFHGLVDGPHRIFTEDIPLSQVPFEWALQLFWIVFFVLLGRILVSAGRKRLVVQGG